MTTRAVVIAACLFFAAGGLAHARDHRVLWLRDVYHDRELRLVPFGRHGLVGPRERRRLRRFFAARTGERHAVESRLLWLLRRVETHFDGHRLELLSGFRVPADRQPLTSYHQVGHAADLWVAGVANRDLFEYCRSLPLVGCGLYPNGSHVHLDARSRESVWVDLSGHGETAVYVGDASAWLKGHPGAGRARQSTRFAR